MAKITKRLNIKGEIDIERGTITEFDKDMGEIEHNISDIFRGFSGIDDVTLTLAHDSTIE